MIKRVLYNGITWIDLESPSAEEVAQLASEFNLHELVASELLSKSLRPKIDLHKKYIYLILHFIEDKEVDFVLGKDFIITTRYEEVEPVMKFSRALSLGEQMHDTDFNSGVLFYYITKGLYEEMEDELTRLRVHMKSIEESVYSGREREMVLTLAKSGKEILDMHQSLDPHKDVLTNLEKHAREFYGPKYTRYASALLGNFYKVHQRIKRISALHSELRATNDSLLASKQNSIMQVFTIVAFVTLIPSLISSIFGMNALNMPFIGHPLDFWIILVIMATASASVFGFFRFKKWL
jgi:magnesium transporter